MNRDDIRELNDTPVPLHITFRGVTPTDAAERVIRSRVDGLGGPRGHVTRVVVERDRRRRRRAEWREPACRAQLVVALANGRQFSVRGRAHPQPLVAIAEVFAAARRLLRQRPAPRVALDLAG